MRVGTNMNTRTLKRVRTSVLTILLCSATSGALCATPAPAGAYDSYLGVKAYRLRLGWTAGDQSRSERTVGECTENGSFEASIAANVSFKLVRSRDGRGAIAVWRPEKDSIPEGAFAYSSVTEKRSKCKDSKDPETVFRQTISGGGIGDGEGNLTIDTTTGEFSFAGYVSAADGFVHQEFLPGGASGNSPGGLTLASGNGSFPGATSEITGTLVPNERSIHGPAIEMKWPNTLGLCPKPLLFTWSVEPWEDEDTPEVTVEPVDYASWLPEGNLDNPDEPGDTPLLVRITVHRADDSGTSRAADLFISLPYVSRNKGVCMNWPKGATGRDGLRFRQEDFADDPDFSFVDSLHVESTRALESAFIRVHAYDYGAWGTLRVVATAQGKDAKVKVLGKETPDLAIPQDDNTNRIADGWEKENGCEGRTFDWDAETVAGQDQTGDNISLYDEYRGLVVPDPSGGGKGQFKRLDPNAKEIFVIDPGRVFLASKWQQITGVVTTRLDESLVDPAGNPGPGESPLVNFNAEDRLTFPTYALKIVVRSDDSPDSPFPAYAESGDEKDWCIKKAIVVNVFPARFKARVDEDYRWLNKAILEPDSSEGVELRERGPVFQIPFEDANNAWSTMVDPAVLPSIAERLQTAVVFHEIGHFCGVADHKDVAPDGHEDEARGCLMFNQGPWGRRRTLIFTALGRGDVELVYPYVGFCRDLGTPGYRCFRSLRIKDCAAP